MIQSVTVRNFQSLQDVTLDFAPLTVIVGQSSSGKSALIRALQALIRNRRGTEFITHGERVSSISAILSTGTVTLTRSTQTAPNAYTVIPTDRAHSLAPKAEFTKLGGETPAPISAFLGITPTQAPLTIASQFDQPFLLSASPTEAARIFGSLTNASVLLDGARESNRRKLAATALLRTRSQDLAQIQERVPEFRALREQSHALTQAEDLIARARTLSTTLNALSLVTDTLTIAQSAIPALRARLASLPDPQALTARLDALTASYARTQARTTLFHRALTLVNTHHLALTVARTNETSAQTAVKSASRDLAHALSGFEKALAIHMRENALTLDSENKLDLDEASKLATAYVTSLDG